MALRKKISPRIFEGIFLFFVNVVERAQNFSTELNEIFIRTHDQNISVEFKVAVKIFDAARIKIFHAAIFPRVQVQIKFLLQAFVLRVVIRDVTLLEADEFYVRVHGAQLSRRLSEEPADNSVGRDVDLLGGGTLGQTGHGHDVSAEYDHEARARRNFHLADSHEEIFRAT